MSQWQQFIDIILDNDSDDIYTPGDVIRGRIVLVLSQPECIKGLYVTCEGKGEVNWKVTTGSGDDEVTTNYEGYENYFLMKAYLVGRNDGRKFSIEAGTHVFPFDFRLLSNIPSSFSDTYGHVKYTITAVLDRSSAFEQRAIYGFNVVTPYYLSETRNAMTPIEDEGYRTFCCFPICCFRMGALKYNLSMPVRGFAVNDEIEIRIDLKNTSKSVKVKKMQLQIGQVILYHSQFPEVSTKKVDSIVFKSHLDRQFRETESFIAGIEVPQLPSTNLVYCSLIDIKYYLRVIFNVSGCHCCLSKDYPIIIGTKPTLADPSVQIPTVIPAPKPTAPVPTAPLFPVDDEFGRMMPGASNHIPNYGSTFSAANQNIAPPTYNETMGIKE